MRRLASHLTVFCLVLLWLIPTLGLLVTSIRPYEDVVRTGWWTTLFDPAKWASLTLDNYVQVIAQEGLGQAFWNSLVITIPASLIPLAISALAAYAFAWMPFRGRQVLLMVAVGLMVLPGQMTFIPLLTVYNKVGLSGTFLGIWLVHTAYGLPLQIYLLRNFFRALPHELLDSAFMDGASRWKIFRHIVLPLSVPALASLLILQFLWVWNDLLVALIFLGTSPEVAPVNVKLVGLVGAYGQDWQLLTAGAFVSMALPLIVFLSLQKHFVQGILAGSRRG
ncbi:MAG: sugar ABC transporter permease [Candidatus Fraserbacteria bacterium RBG_16_55_9]|uniref:Sugar ABC transporter permease n=1 Tax=Fraserbacteria sp. (strain RBG_16_55_9) TaxID=1817864 RepID=A0A1F5UWL1_FRAXR|nr:MAG: sugar ABC transporter permease [Candidatus Fraserbacteria bacterium RBG_16_55_9]